MHAAKAPSQMVALINADGETVGESEMPCSPPLRFKISGSDRLHEECMQQGRGVGGGVVTCLDTRSVGRTGDGEGGGAG